MQDLLQPTISRGISTSSTGKISELTRPSACSTFTSVLEGGLCEYRELVYRSKRGYNMLMNMQYCLLNNIVPDTIKKAACSRVFSKLFQKMYLGIG